MQKLRRDSVQFWFERLVASPLSIPDFFFKSQLTRLITTPWYLYICLKIARGLSLETSLILALRCITGVDFSNWCHTTDVHHIYFSPALAARLSRRKKKKKKLYACVKLCDLLKH